MAYLLNRSLSMVSNGFGVLTTSESSSTGKMMDLADLNLATNGDSTNPLRIFTSAKKDINKILEKVEAFVKNVQNFYASYDEEMVGNQQANLVQIENCVEKINGIREVLKRNHMKVAFFGRTSNGKSTVINSILQNKILPAGIGHTTNCFIQVEGTDEEEPYIEVEGVRQEIENVKQIANALNTESMGDSTLVKIFWPKERCAILREDVVLVDSPGTDVTDDLDQCIDLYCMDADVFVLVSNAESTLMQTEKNFFFKVKEKLSKPNVFILNNRWDASAGELDSIDLVRKQHTSRDVDFLVRELNVVDVEQAQDRVFFVSAKEVLQSRMLQDQGQPLALNQFAEGFEKRYKEFCDFEQKFEVCLSKSAVQTKFRQHTLEVMNMLTDIKTLLEDVFKKTHSVKTVKTRQVKQIKDRINLIRQQFQVLTNEVKHQICHLVKQVEHKVSTAFNDEIKRLAVLVNDFEKPFSTDSQALVVYKKNLHSHVENGLGSNLKSRLSAALSCNVDSTQKQMFEGAKRFVPEINTDSLLSYSVAPSQDFKLIYRINCESLCSDFQEDLQFRFSYGLVQLINYFYGGKCSSITDGKDDKIPSNSDDFSKVATNLQSKLDLIDALSNTRTTITVLAIGGCVVRAIGWHVVAITTGIYGLLYIYERVSWTTRAKENTFKKQYVAHATKKLRLIVDLTSANCSHQVQQELSTSFARLNRSVDGVLEALQNDMKKQQQECEFLERQDQLIKVLCEEVNGMKTELGRFAEKYLLEQ